MATEDRSRRRARAKRRPVQQRLFGRARRGGEVVGDTVE